MKRMKKTITGIMLSAFTLLGCGCSYLSDLTDKVDELFCMHKNVETVVGFMSTCVDVGYTDGKRCADCGKVLEKHQKIPALGHNYQVLPAVEPTCSKTGLTQGEQCARCYDISIPQKILSPTGHTWNSYSNCTLCGLNYEYLLSGEYTLRLMETGDTFANKWLRIKLEDVTQSGFLFVGDFFEDTNTYLYYGFAYLPESGFCIVDENQRVLQGFNVPECVYGIYYIDVYIPAGDYSTSYSKFLIRENTVISTFFNDYGETNISIYEIVKSE